MKTSADWFANPGSILRPDESQLVRLTGLKKVELPESLNRLWLNFTRPPLPWNKIRVVKTLFPELHEQLITEQWIKASPSKTTRL